MNQPFRCVLLLLALAFPILLLSSCGTTGKVAPIQYEYLQVERQGGGQIDFRIYPGESRSNLYVYVSTSNFQTVDKRIQLLIDTDNAEAFDEFYQALNGQMALSGDQKTDKKLKGSWLYLRFYRGTQQTEITNPNLLQRFSLFEQLVRERIQ